MHFIFLSMWVSKDCKIILWKSTRYPRNQSSLLILILGLYLCISLVQYIQIVI